MERLAGQTSCKGELGDKHGVSERDRDEYRSERSRGWKGSAGRRREDEIRKSRAAIRLAGYPLELHSEEISTLLNH